MPANSAERRHHVARVAGLKRHRPADDPDVQSAENDLAAARIDDEIRRIVESAPKLSAEHADQLRALLPPVVEDGPDAVA